MAVTYLDTLEVLIYDAVVDLWFNSLTSFPSLGHIHNNPIIATSADVVTVAVRADNAVNIYRLTSRLSSLCTINQTLFNFTITSDKFPQDIDWYLKDQQGKIIFGGRLYGDATKTENPQQSMNTKFTQNVYQAAMHISYFLSRISTVTVFVAIGEMVISLWSGMV